MVEETKNPVNQDDAGRTLIIGILYHFAKSEHPTWCPGSVLWEKAQLHIRKDVGFANEKEFRLFMAGLVEAGLVQEKHGRTMVEPELKNLRFALSNWFHALCMGIRKDAKKSQR